jgi:hypothetical protein
MFFNDKEYEKGQIGVYIIGISSIRQINIVKYFTIVKTVLCSGFKRWSFSF